MKLLLILALLLQAPNTTTYEVVEVQNNLITIDMSGQLENWYVDDENDNIEKGDKVVIVNDRLIEVE